MRTKPLPPAEQCFVDGHDLRNGTFVFMRRGGQDLLVIASDGSNWESVWPGTMPWEHVSVSLAHRCPTWDEMTWVKNLWWSENETVIEFHVPASQHVNYHPYCLHLWKPVGLVIPLPPRRAVGPVGRSAGG